MSASAAFAQVSLPGGGTAANVVTFGDSLSDGGNFKAQNPGAAFNAPYLGGATFLNGAPNPLPLNLNRFTNGPTWAEILAVQTGAGAPRLFGTGAIPAGANVNYAFGASRSDNSTATPARVGTEVTLGPALGITGVLARIPPGGPLPPATGEGALFGIANVPGLPNQIASFIANGGTFGPRSLVTIWSGANDIFQASAGYPTPAQAAIAPVTAAQNVGVAVGQVVAAGGRNILVNNLPDLGATPSSLAGGAAAIAQANAASNAYNATLNAAIGAAGAAAPAGTNIILVDVNKAFRDVTLNPARYGFANVTNPCVTTPACVGGSAATQATFAFWDSVHPTAASHALIAALATDYLNVGEAAQAAARIPYVAADLRNRASGAALSRLRNVQARTRLLGPGAVGENEATIEFDALTTSWGSSSKLNAGTVRVLADRAFTPEIRGGVAFSYAFGKADIGPRMSLDVSSFSGDAYLGWAQPGGGLFVNGTVGASYNDFSNIRRTTLFFGTVNTSSTDGTAISGAAEVGYAIRLLPTLTLSPHVGIEALSAHVDSFSESASPTARIAYRSRTFDAFGGVAGLRLDALIAGTLIGHLRISYGHAFSQTGGTYGVGIVDNPSLIAPVAIASRKRGSLNFGAGLSGDIMPNLTLSAEYRGATPVSGGGSSHLGRISLTAKF